ncbi:hypothetical protein V8C35DRAFT_160327 [Trichoderma chlorosporum]
MPMQGTWSCMRNYPPRVRSGSSTGNVRSALSLSCSSLSVPVKCRPGGETVLHHWLERNSKRRCCSGQVWVDGMETKSKWPGPASCHWLATSTTRGASNQRHPLIWRPYFPSSKLPARITSSKARCGNLFWLQLVESDSVSSCAESHATPGSTYSYSTVQFEYTKSFTEPTSSLKQYDKGTETEDAMTASYPDVDMILCYSMVTNLPLSSTGGRRQPSHQSSSARIPYPLALCAKASSGSANPSPILNC